MSRLDSVARKVEERVKEETGISLSVTLEAGKGKVIENEEGTFWQIPIRLEAHEANDAVSEEGSKNEN